jgi:hypothetical protein
LLKIEQKAIYATCKKQSDEIKRLTDLVQTQQIQFANAMAEVNARCGRMEQELVNAKYTNKLAIGLSIAAGGVSVLSGTIGLQGVIAVIKGAFTSLTGQQVAVACAATV